MQSIINLKVKFRESFRPFAPSVLRESVPEWFELDGDVPFMMQVYPIRAEKRALISAVTHVDGSGRLQTVQRDSNPLYYRLIEAFRDLTGVPMVLISGKLAAQRVQEYAGAARPTPVVAAR